MTFKAQSFKSRKMPILSVEEYAAELGIEFALTLDDVAAELGLDFFPEAIQPELPFYHIQCCPNYLKDQKDLKHLKDQTYEQCEQIWASPYWNTLFQDFWMLTECCKQLALTIDVDRAKAAFLRIMEKQKHTTISEVLVCLHDELC